MNRLSTLFIIIYAAFLASCAHTVPVSLREKSDSCDVRIAMSLYKDSVNPWVGVPGVGWKITITNHSSQELTDCVFIMNDRYELPLKQASIHVGFFEGRKLFGRSTLNKGETVVLQYSSDGGCLFVDEDHNVLDYFTMPTRLTLKASCCTRSWDLLTEK